MLNLYGLEKPKETGRYLVYYSLHGCFKVGDEIYTPDDIVTEICWYITKEDTKDALSSLENRGEGFYGETEINLDGRGLTNLLLKIEDIKILYWEKVKELSIPEIVRGAEATYTTFAKNEENT